MVVWTRSQGQPAQNAIQDRHTPLEIYMEGNVVFRESDRVIYAGRMYYDVPNQVGTVLDADMLTPVPKYPGGLLRLHAQVLQQVSPQKFLAHDAFFTPSRFGIPGYRLKRERRDPRRTNRTRGSIRPRASRTSSTTIG